MDDMPECSVSKNKDGDIYVVITHEKGRETNRREFKSGDKADEFYKSERWRLGLGW